jgi:hypothetical protein
MSIMDGVSGYGVYAVGGEWLEYTCSAEPGFYTLRIRCATYRYTVQSFTVSDETGVIATATLPPTGGWSTWQDVIIPDVYLSGGSEKVLRFTVGDGVVILNYAEFERQYHAADLDRTGIVDMEDFSVLSSQWLGEPNEPSADIAPAGGDGWVDLLDLAELAENWLIMQ